MLITGVQQRDSVIPLQVSILFQLLFPFKLLQNIESSSLCYTVGPCWLSILNMVVCTCQSQIPNQTHFCIPRVLLLRTILLSALHSALECASQWAESFKLTSLLILLGSASGRHMQEFGVWEK